LISSPTSDGLTSRVIGPCWRPLVRNAMRRALVLTAFTCRVATSKTPSLRSATAIGLSTRISRTVACKDRGLALYLTSLYIQIQDIVQDDGYARWNHVGPAANLHRRGGRRQLFGRRAQAAARAIRGQSGAGQSGSAAGREALRPLRALSEAHRRGTQPARRRPLSG